MRIDAVSMTSGASSLYIPYTQRFPGVRKAEMPPVDRVTSVDGVSSAGRVEGVGGVSRVPEISFSETLHAAISALGMGQIGSELNNTFHASITRKQNAYNPIVSQMKDATAFYDRQMGGGTYSTVGMNYNNFI